MHRLHLTSRASRRLLLGTATLCLALAPAPALAADAGGSDGTILLCEATGNPSAPYVEIRVAQSNVGDYGAAQGDIIPAPAGGCPSSVSGGAAPVETGASTTSVSTSASEPATSPASTPAPAAPAPKPTPRHGSHAKSHAKSHGGVKGTGVGALGSAPSLTSTNPLQRQTTTPVSTLRELPRTGGEVPLTLMIGFSLLLGAAVPALLRRRRSRA